MNKEEYLKREEKRLRKKETQMYKNTVKTINPSLCCFLLLKGHKIIKIKNMDAFSIPKNINTKILVDKFYGKSVFVDPLVYGKTLINFVNENNLCDQ